MALRQTFQTAVTAVVFALNFKSVIKVTLVGKPKVPFVFLDYLGFKIAQGVNVRCLEYALSFALCYKSLNGTPIWLPSVVPDDRFMNSKHGVHGHSVL